MSAYQAQNGSSNKMLYALAEELKLPFIQVAKNAELGRISGNIDNYKIIETTSEAALKLLDSYVLSSQVQINQAPLKLDSVSVTSVLYDSSQNLSRFTKLYNTKIDVVVDGKCGLVMANKSALEAAMTSLAYTFICASEPGSVVTLLAKKGNNNISAGVLSTNSNINKNSLKKAQKLYGNARQPIAELTHNQGAGLYVADTLFSSMDSHLDYSKYRSNKGLMATFLPSKQLALL